VTSVRERTHRAPGGSGTAKAVQVNVLQPLNRCPYCHDACRPEEAVVCRDCLARHHEPCWAEHGACSACASAHRLVAESGPAILIRGPRAEEAEPEARTSSSRPARLVFLSQAAALFLVPLAAFPFSSTEIAVWGSLATLLLSEFLLLRIFLKRRPASWLPLWIQTGILMAGWILTPLLVDLLALSPNESSLVMWALGTSLGGLSLGTGILLPKDDEEAEEASVGRQEPAEPVPQDDA